MKKILTCLLATLGLTSACGQAKEQREQSRMNSSFAESRLSSNEAQQNFENTDVQGFSELITNPDVILLDVRTADEYAEGHIEGAILIDQKQSDFMEKAKDTLPIDKTIAVYCRSGRRSANAADKLADIGYKCVNLKGGIIAWKEAGMPVTTDTYEVDVFKTKSGKTAKFHALIHASIRIQYDGKEIQVDPVTKLGDKTIDYASMPKADYLLVTHEHFDHFNQDAIKLLTGDKTRFITNQRCADIYGSGEVMKNGDKLKIADDFTIEAVPAYNYTEGRTQFHPKGRDNGFILTIDGLRIYIAGDTEDIPEMSAVKDIDIAFLPCNQPYTMTPDQLIKAAKIIKPKVLFPYHYGQTDVSRIPGQLKGDDIDVRIRHYE
jgi:L-ascorbate metabolism protein UlaG (beta-lactamase superfamily)/rhodanese-related sulfurtransferase